MSIEVRDDAQRWRRTILSAMRSNAGRIMFRRLFAYEQAELQQMEAEGLIERLPGPTHCYAYRLRANT